MSSDSDAILDGEDAESEAPSNDAVVMDCYSESAVDMDTNHSSDQHAGREEGRGISYGADTSWSEVCRPASLLRFTPNLKEADPKIDFFQWFRQLVNCTEAECQDCLQLAATSVAWESSSTMDRLLPCAV